MNRIAEGSTAVSIRSDIASRANKDLEAKQQEIDRLKEEIASFENGGKPGAAHAAGSRMGADRLVEELNRRIKAFEQAQKEAALELAREKEARLKAEKYLAITDRRQEDTANHMESAKIEMRKEIEASVKHREGDVRKALKDLQEEVDALQAHNRIVTAELEGARRHSADLEALLGGGVDSKEAAAAFFTQTMERMETEISGYRDRLKVIMQERDAARAELEKGAPEGRKKSGAGA